MTQRISQNRYAQAISRLADWVKVWLVPTLLRRRIFGIAFIASVLAVLYWGLIASDLYVSEAHVIIVRTDMSSGSSQSASMLGGVGGGNSTDFIAFQLWLRDYLLSVDMMNTLDTKLNLRAHYSDWLRDPLSRIWFKDMSLERFHDYYLSRVSAELDNNSGALIIQSQAYDPNMAHAITAMMVEEGERYMNAMAKNLAEEQVSFLEKQIDNIRGRDLQARQLLLSFQDRKGMVSPLTTAASIDTVVNGLDSQRTALQASRNALLAYLMPNNPSILVLDQQIEGIEKQINTEKARLASAGGKTLNNTADEFQRLQINVSLLDATYQAATTALETARVQAALTLRKVFVLQAPTMPQYPLAPRRIYNTVVFILVVLLIVGIVHLFAAIIRDHMD
jgi:capsular polysaccharide transport system permease protein